MQDKINLRNRNGQREGQRDENLLFGNLVHQLAEQLLQLLDLGLLAALGRLEGREHYGQQHETEDGHTETHCAGDGGWRE